jgi:hypothetical protein
MRRNWQQEAAIAIDQLKLVGHGEREREMVSIARSLSGQADASGLRRAIVAYEFLLRLKSARPTEYEALQFAPLAVVAAIGKWHSSDPAKALSVARDYGNGIGTAKSIGQAMSSVRKGFAGKTGGAFERAYTIAAKSSVVYELEKFLRTPVGVPAQSVKDPQTGTVVDFVFTLPEAGEARQRIAVLIVGPYTNRKLYAHRCADWVAKGFGLCWFYDRVVLALPDTNSMKEYARRAMIASSKESSEEGLPVPIKPRLDILPISVSPLTDEQEDALVWHADPAR